MYVVAIGNNPRPQGALRQRRPTVPGSLLVSGLMALNRCVTPARPGRRGQQLRVTGIGVSRADVQPTGDQLAQLSRCQMPGARVTITLRSTSEHSQSISRPGRPGPVGPVDFRAVRARNGASRGECPGCPGDLFARTAPTAATACSGGRGCR